MGMCAIYTAVPPSSPDELRVLARSNEATVYGAHRRTLGRRAVAELVALCAPATHAEFARTILGRDLWAFLTPAASRGNHAAVLQRVHEDLVVPVPVWPSSTELACLVGVPPAHYFGSKLVLLPPDLVSAGVTAFETHEDASEVASYLNEFLRDVRDRNRGLLLHWDYR